MSSASASGSGTVVVDDDAAAHPNLSAGFTPKLPVRGALGGKDPAALTKANVEWNQNKKFTSTKDLKDK